MLDSRSLSLGGRLHCRSDNAYRCPVMLTNHNARAKEKEREREQEREEEICKFIFIAWRWRAERNILNVLLAVNFQQSFHCYSMLLYLNRISHRRVPRITSDSYLNFGSSNFSSSPRHTYFNMDSRDSLLLVYSKMRVFLILWISF